MFAFSLNIEQLYLTHMTLLGDTTMDQSELGSNGNEGVLFIPQSSSATRASPTDCLVSYSMHSLGESYLIAEMQSVYSAVTADWAKLHSSPSNQNLFLVQTNSFNIEKEDWSLICMFITIEVILEMNHTRIFICKYNNNS